MLVVAHGVADATSMSLCSTKDAVRWMQKRKEKTVAGGQAQQQTEVACSQAQQQSEVEQRAEVEDQGRYRLAVEKKSAAVCGSSAAERKGKNTKRKRWCAAKQSNNQSWNSKQKLSSKTVSAGG